MYKTSHMDEEIAIVLPSPHHPKGLISTKKKAMMVIFLSKKEPDENKFFHFSTEDLHKTNQFKLIGAPDKQLGNNDFADIEAIIKHVNTSRTTSPTQPSSFKQCLQKRYLPYCSHHKTKHQASQVLPTKN